MVELVRGILKAMEEGRRGALVTVVGKRGSAPRQTGAKMFVTDDGLLLGTVGGGSVEAYAGEQALKCLDSGKSLLLHYGMQNPSLEQDGMVCGGDVDLFIEPVLGRHETVFRTLLESARKGRRALVATRTEGPLWKTVIAESGQTAGDPVDEAEVLRLLTYLKEKTPVLTGNVLIEPLTMASHLFIFGAGHVSQYVVRVAKMVNFRVSVIDDRAEFANRERFPDADEIIVDDFSRVFDDLDRSGDIYIVIVTRGHKHDAAVLEKSLSLRACYVGMIGSRRKVAIVMEHLKEKGISEDKLKWVHSPIGIDIHSETPEEIGVSIVAELIKVRAEC
jgi:xanthine dehydrogenase accessory factor